MQEVFLQNFNVIFLTKLTMKSVLVLLTSILSLSLRGVGGDEHNHIVSLFVIVAYFVTLISLVLYGYVL